MTWSATADRPDPEMTLRPLTLLKWMDSLTLAAPPARFGMSVDSMSARPLRVTELSTASVTTPTIGKLLALRTAACAAPERQSPARIATRDEGRRERVNDEGMFFIDSCCAHCTYRLEVRSFECVFQNR